MQLLVRTVKARCDGELVGRLVGTTVLRNPAAQREA
jgi:hypothetical protein